MIVVPMLRNVEETIAGITNKKGNVLAIMPHPERAISSFSGKDGLSFFKGLSGVI